MTILGDTNPPRFPIGQSDYALVRRQRLTYVDKTMWVADVLDGPDVVTLVPRPRRFGKTLNMTTLRYFVDRSVDDTTELFEDTAVWSADGGRYRQHFRRYPVIYLTFKDLKEPSMEALGRRIGPLLATMVRTLARTVPPHHEPTSDELRIAMLQHGDRPLHEYTDALLDVSRWLHRSTGQQAIVLIDEYDAPLHAAWQYGYWDEAVLFFRNLFSAGLKDNPHLFKGVLTGILKVAKEGIFSGMNHLRTASILGDPMNEHFGFTEAEVAELAAIAEPTPEAGDMQRWYNGYRFGQTRPVTIYNPWSVLNYLQTPGGGPRSFWKNTSDNALIHSQLRRHAAFIGPMVHIWLEGGCVEQIVDENVALTQLDHSPGALLGLLLFSGYLTATGIVATERGLLAQLRIPNLEVRGVYVEVFAAWLEAGASTYGPRHVDMLTRALLTGDAREAERGLTGLLATMLSFHDTGGRRVEAVYQAFVVGLLVHLERTHFVRSNRESGHGRADVLIVPRQPGPGAVLELKVLDSRMADTVESCLDEAIAQIVDRDYAAEVRAAGANAVYAYAVVFDGKRAWVRKANG